MCIYEIWMLDTIDEYKVKYNKLFTSIYLYEYSIWQIGYTQPIIHKKQVEMEF